MGIFTGKRLVLLHAERLEYSHLIYQGHKLLIVNHVVSTAGETWPRWDSVIVERLVREFQQQVPVGQKMNVQWEGRELLGQTQMEIITRPPGVSTKPIRTGSDPVS